MTTIYQARQRVANRYKQPYLVRAILNGEWDNGSLVRNAASEIEAEREECEGKKKK